MRLRTWPVLAVAFCTLLVLMAVTELATQRKAQQIYEQFSGLNRRHKQGNQILHEIRSDLHLSAILARDYLLDPSHISAELYRSQLIDLRASILDKLDRAPALLELKDTAKARQLRDEVDVYWQSLDPLFTWTPHQKASMSSWFLRRVVLPRRNAVFELAREVEELSRERLQFQEQAIAAGEAEYERFLGRVFLSSLCLGLAVSVAAILRIKQLEHRSSDQHARSEKAEEEMRNLSLKLVRAQEEERKSLSRELHDEVGQMLTALRMELGKAERMHRNADGHFQVHLDETKRLLDVIVRSVRDMAMGLRPSMLDDLGLSPALEWQARDFARRYSVPVDVHLEGDLQQLPETYRTCVFRVVQEALTNCARHSEATAIQLSVKLADRRLDVEIRDNGVGVRTGQRRTGLGLIGMQERVRELGGALRVSSEPEEGTVLAVVLPVEASTFDAEHSNLTR